MSQEKSLKIEVGDPTRDYACFDASLEGGRLSGVQVRLYGSHRFLKTAVSLRDFEGKEIDKLPKFEEGGYVGQLLNEMVLRIQGRWAYPYDEIEICHCRQVPTAVVDAAIVNGAHSSAEVARKTSAGTGCGTCRPDIDKIIEYRKKL